MTAERKAVIAISVGLPLFLAGTVAIVYFATRGSKTDSSPSGAEVYEQTDGAKFMAEYREDNEICRKALHKLVRARLKNECEFKDERIAPTVGGSGEVIVSNDFGAKRRMKWSIYFKDEFKNLSRSDRNSELQLLWIDPAKHVNTFSIGDVSILRDGRIVESGKQ